MLKECKSFVITPKGSENQERKKNECGKNFNSLNFHSLLYLY